MAVAYDIKAHPTVYGARQFRSRLEAKWASFFDLAGWQFEYEPFDLEGWSPDFLLNGATKVLVEVKPISEPDADTQARMQRAANAAGWDGELLLVGVAPLFDMATGPYESPAIGWLAQRYGGSDLMAWDRASACMSDTQGYPLDFCHATMDYKPRIFGGYFKDCVWLPDSRWLKSAWDRAANRVQWHKR